MRARIHRGARQIGGSCIELESDGRRLVLDLGRPLEATRLEHVPLPDVAGLRSADPSLLGIVLSHPHQDHWGQIPDLQTEVPVYAGARAGHVLREAAFFGAGAYAVREAAPLQDRQPLQVGPFRILPIAVDHSATDAYSLLVEADGETLFYTGDFRAHGRHRQRFDHLVASPPGPVDTLLMEGTHVRHDGAPPRESASEAEVQVALEATFRAASGPVLLACSAQNIDRLCGAYEACVATGRTLVVDLYAATMATASGVPDAPQPGWPNYRIWLPQRQRVRIKRAGAFERARLQRHVRIFPEAMAEAAATAVFLYREGLAAELERADCVEGATLVWSLWRGYLDGPAGKTMRERIARHRWQVRDHHASGHAGVTDLQKLARALLPKKVVPIHTFGAENYPALFDNVVLHEDGTWWEVA